MQAFNPIDTHEEREVEREHGVLGPSREGETKERERKGAWGPHTAHAHAV